MFNTIAFQYFNGKCLNYLNKVFKMVLENNFQTRKNSQELICPFRKTNPGQTALSSIGLAIYIKTQETNISKRLNIMNEYEGMKK